MADFEIIEADFQQFYNIDVSGLGFQRYARLLINLPAESRFIQKYSPFKDWNWEKEIQSQILRSIDAIATIYANVHRKKGTPAIKPPDQVQPDYVVKAKKDAKVKKKKDNQLAQESLIKEFESRNKNTKQIGDIINGL